jgi:hypothetical protein
MNMGATDPGDQILKFQIMWQYNKAHKIFLLFLTYF